MKSALLSVFIVVISATFAAVPLKGGDCYGPITSILKKLRPPVRQALKQALDAFNYDQIQSIITSKMSLFPAAKRRQLRQWLDDAAPPPAIVTLMANTTTAEKNKLKRAIDNKDRATVVRMFSSKVMALNPADQAEVVNYFVKMIKACYGN